MINSDPRRGIFVAALCVLVSALAAEIFGLENWAIFPRFRHLGVGRCVIFPIILGIITPTDELIFFRGVETTNQPILFRGVGCWKQS
jgi:hypothetical protein